MSDGGQCILPSEIDADDLDDLFWIVGSGLTASWSIAMAERFPDAECVGIGQYTSIHSLVKARFTELTCFSCRSRPY